MRGTESVESVIYYYILKFTFNKIGRKLGSLCKKELPKIEKNRPYWAGNQFFFLWCDT